jgi:hypothetical protein
LEDDCFEAEKDVTSFDFSHFKKALKMFVIEKKIVAVDLNSEYVEYAKAKTNKSKSVRN